MSEASSDFLTFLGRFHPILVHLPIGVLFAVGLLELAALRPAWRPWSAANRALLVIAIPAGLAAATCGWFLARDGGYDATLLDRHRWTGVATALAIPIVALLHARGPVGAYRVGLGALLAMVSGAGHFGGSLTHGSDFLLQPAPAFLRRALGYSGPADHGQPASTDPATGPVFEAAVRPVLERYCTSCHGTEKSKGGLRLDSLEAITKGGDSGPAVQPRRAAESLLVSRIALPGDHDEHMPPSGKRQPTVEETALLTWWINAGAPVRGSARELGAPESVLRMLGAPRPPAAP